METVHKQANRSGAVSRGRGVDSKGTDLSRMGSIRESVRSIVAGETLQTKLTVGAPDHQYEQEAERVADEVMRMPDAVVATSQAHDLGHSGDGAGPLGNAAPHIQRMCPECEQELQRESEEADEKAGEIDFRTSFAVPEALGHQIDSIRGNGSELPTTLRGYFEPRFAGDFSRVRIHNDARAHSLARSLNAMAFTVGHDMVFSKGSYAPDSNAGRHLLAHELTHVVQQNGPAPRAARSAATQSGGQVSRVIQRTTHGLGGSAYTPTNCANPLIPLSARMAGVAAHGQIAAILSSMGIHPMTIPRATKRRLGMPAPPGTNLGFADLWTEAGGMARISEIKSTNIGHTRARLEADHYALRHNEWNLRWPNTFLDDVAYRALVGSHPVPGTVLDTSAFTGTGMALGPFVADPGKLLFAEGDALGAMVYWCQGPGIINPLILWALKQALDRLRDYLNSLKRWLQDIFDNLPPLPAPSPAEVNRILALLLLLAALVLIVVAIACFAGVVTAPCGVLAGGAALASAGAALLLLGINIPGITSGSDPLLASMREESYSRPSRGGGGSADTVAGNMAAALSSIPDPATIAAQAAPNLDQSRARETLRGAIRAMTSVGSEDDAAFVSGSLARV